MEERVDEFLPLAPTMLHILVALAGESLHGYGIMEEVLRQTDSCFKLGPGTLYDNLQRLVKQGLVEEVAGLPRTGEFKAPVLPPHFAWPGRTHGRGCASGGSY